DGGIRAFHVTGVQTCALPIFLRAQGGVGAPRRAARRRNRAPAVLAFACCTPPNPEPMTVPAAQSFELNALSPLDGRYAGKVGARSEERRVGRGCGLQSATRHS